MVSVEWCQDLYYRFISKLCKRIFGYFTPNQITIFNLLFTLIFGSYFFTRGTWGGNLCGLAVLLINGLLDYVDGDLAKSNNKVSLAGQWFDKGGDMLIQNIIMASIAYTICVNRGSQVELLVVIVFFIGLNAMNTISIFYNNTFGFDSHNGNDLFRDFMDLKKEKPERNMLSTVHIWSQNAFNRFMKNLVDPTASLVGLILWTVRYFLVLGIVLNQMFIAFSIITVLMTFRWIMMFILYAMHLAEKEYLWVLHALASMDKERQEYYKVRGQ